MVRDLRSPEQKAAAQRKWKRDAAKSEREERRIVALFVALWKRPAPWQPIKSFPFPLLAEHYGGINRLMVSDGKSVAVVSVRQRFGAPIHWEVEPEMAMTDGGIAYVGGKVGPRIHPEWWYEWEFRDVTERVNQYGDPVEPEIDFVPTHWVPLPPMPSVDKRKRAPR